jgi:hypothetical protein
MKSYAIAKNYCTLCWGPKESEIFRSANSFCYRRKLAMVVRKKNLHYTLIRFQVARESNERWHDARSVCFCQKTSQQFAAGHPYGAAETFLKVSLKKNQTSALSMLSAKPQA